MSTRPVRASASGVRARSGGGRGAQRSHGRANQATTSVPPVTRPTLGTAATKLSLVLAGTTLALAPLPFGSVTPGSIAFWCCLLGVGVMLAPLAHLDRRHWAILGPVLATAALFGIIVLVQSFAAPDGLRDPIWAASEAALGEPVEATLSVAPGLASRALGLQLLMLLAFVGAFLLGADRAQARILILVAAYAGAAYAAYGIAAFAFAPNTLLWVEKHYYLGNLTGTFVNRNTAATYFGTCSVLWMILVVAELDRRLPKTAARFSDTVATLLKTDQSLLIIRLTGFLICLAATLMTASRAGALISILAIVFGVLLHGRGRLRGRIGGWIGLAALALVGLALVELWGGGIGLRLSQNLFRLDQRWGSYGATLAVIQDHFWLGTGLGTYANIFPAYRPSDFMIGIIWDIAHSTPLEIATELGVPFALVFLLLCLYLFVRLVRGALSTSGGAAYAAAGAAVAFLGVAHSSVDFSLQIPGYAVVFTMIVACGLAQSIPRQPRSSTRESDGGPRESAADSYR